ncbi:MAG: hypothetical protein HY905_02885 [Deltaproteobacteria bacterium]|nr:hypothetical protein [Deltaproteobacteria bacterium]
MRNRLWWLLWVATYAAAAGWPAGCGEDTDARDDVAADTAGEDGGGGADADADADGGADADAEGWSETGDDAGEEAEPDSEASEEADSPEDGLAEVDEGGEADAEPDDGGEDAPADETGPSCPDDAGAAVVDVTVGDLHDAIGAGELLTVVDVREPSETASGIIEGALLYPWSSGVLRADHATLPGGPLYVICASGGRSPAAAAFLVENGHTCVHNVVGGMNGWRTAGYPTVTP